MVFGLIEEFKVTLVILQAPDPEQSLPEEFRESEVKEIYCKDSVQ